MSEQRNEYINNYKKEHYKRINLNIDKEFYETDLAAEAQRQGMKVNTFIKEAISEKLERESKG